MMKRQETGILENEDKSSKVNNGDIHPRYLRVYAIRQKYC